MISKKLLLAFFLFFSICSFSIAQNCTAIFSHTNNGLQTTFFDHSLGVNPITKYYWSFGDGDTSNLKEPTHTYIYSGVYNVCLTISDTNNCLSTMCDSIIASNINGNCKANFNYTISKNNSVTFSNLTAPISQYNYKWDFGDSSISNVRNPVHQYSSPGKYIVKLNSRIQGITTCSTIDSLFVNYCSASFVYNDLSNGLIEFIGKKSASDKYSVTWDFGDGSAIGDGLHELHTYASSGLYKVTLNIFDSLSNYSCSYTDSVRVNIPLPCSSGFTYGINNSTVHIFNTAQNYKTIKYTFGDGDSSTSANPVHTYQSNGSYIVCQTIVNPLSNCLQTFCDTIKINTPKFCKANFATQVFMDSVTIINGVTSFTDISYNMGDGTNIQTPEPKHKYNSPGQYKICQFIYDSLSNCRDTICKTINIQIPPKCKAGFRYSLDNSKLEINSEARFIDYIHYDFGDGNTSTQSNPIHNYLREGNYIITQTVENSVTNCKDVFVDSVQIIFPPKCLAGFTYAIHLDTLKLLNQASNFTGLQYTLGDGNSTLNENPIHVYKRSGSYTICQTVVNSITNCSETKCETIQIVLPKTCEANFTYAIKQDTLILQNLSSTFTTVEYDFGDGFSTTELNPTHVYEESNTYNVCQTIYDASQNCFSTKCENISVIVPPTCMAGFDVEINKDSVQFTNRANHYNRIEYDFGDGSPTTFVENPLHIYSSSGTYIVKQIAFNDLRECSDLYIDTLLIAIPTSCVARYEIALDTNKRGTLYLVNTSTNDNTHEYLWSFGDGATGKGRTLTHRYENFGKYEICLTINDATLNCVSTYCDIVGLDSNGYLLKNNGFTLRIIDGSFIGIEEEEIKEADVQLFPNPFDNKINISVPSNVENVQYSILDLSGRLQMQGFLNQSNNELNLEGIKSGIYMVRLDTDKHTLVKKIIKR